MTKKTFIQQSAKKLYISFTCYLGVLACLPLCYFSTTFLFMPFPILIIGGIFNLLAFIDSVKIKANNNGDLMKKIILLIIHLIFIIAVIALFIYVNYLLQQIKK